MQKKASAWRTLLNDIIGKRSGRVVKATPCTNGKNSITPGVEASLIAVGTVRSSLRMGRRFVVSTRNAESAAAIRSQA